MKCNNVRGTDAVDQAGVLLPGASADTFPTGSIDADVLASNTITAAKINADAITSAKIADDALSEEHFDADAAQLLNLGYKVTKDCSLAAANDDLFTVTGKVLITLLTGQVESAALSGAESFQLRVKTSNEPLCAATTLDTDADGTMYVVTGDVGVALNGGDAPTANVTNGSGVPLMPLVVGQAGGTLTIESNTTGNGGTIAWSLFYIPLEASASVAAAA